MSLSSFFLISSGYLDTPSLSVNNYGFYVDLLGNLSYSNNNVNTLKFSDSIELKQTDKNTTLNADTNFQKLIASNEGLLATIGETGRSTLVGILFPKVPNESFTGFSLDQLIWYLNNVRHNDGTQTITFDTGFSTVLNTYAGMLYLPPSDSLLFIPFNQNTQSTIEIINSNGITTVNHTPGETSGYIGGAYSPVNRRGYYIPFGMCDQNDWDYIDAENPTADSRYSHGGSLQKYAYAGGVYDPVYDRIYMAPFKQAPESTWHYLNCVTNQLVEYNNDLTPLIPIRPLPKTYAGAVKNTDDGLIYFIPLNVRGTDQFYGLQRVDPVTLVTTTVTIFASTFVTTANAYVGGAYHPTLDRIYYSPYDQLTLGFQHYYDCATQKVVIVESETTDPFITPHTYFDAVYCSAHDRVYFIPFAQGPAPYWHYIDSDGKLYSYATTVSTVVTNGYAGGVYSAAYDRIYMAPYEQMTQNKWHYIDCATNTVVEYNNTTGFRTAKAYIGAAITADNRVYFAPYNQLTIGVLQYVDIASNTVVDIIYTNRPANAYSGIVPFVYSAGTETFLMLAPNKYGSISQWNWIYTPTPSLIETYNSTVALVGDGTDIFDGSFVLGAKDDATERYFMAPCYQSGTNNWIYIQSNYNGGFPIIDTHIYEAGMVITPLGGSDIIAYQYSGAVYASQVDRMYLVPFNIDNTITQLQYITPSAEIVEYDATNVNVGTDTYMGGAYHEALNRVYFAPFTVDPYSPITYINCATNTLQQYTIPVPTQFPGDPQYYIGAVYDPINERVWFIPFSISSNPIWHYIDSTGNFVAYNHGLSNVSFKAYAGGCYDSNSHRIYAAPALQTYPYKWHYIDCDTATWMEYDSIDGLYIPQDTTELVFLGGAYHPTLDRVYFSPYAQAYLGFSIYVDCTDNSVYTFSLPISASLAFSGAVYANNKIFLVPSKYVDDWYYIEDTTVNSYPKGASNITDSVLIGYGAYTFGDVFSNGNIIMGPAGQSNKTEWGYINSNVPTGNNIPISPAVPSVTVNDEGFFGAIYAPNEQNTWLAPYGQSSQNYWAYIDNDSRAVIYYLHNSTATSNAYVGGAYSPTQNRVYFAPYGQSTQSIWHYVDCATNSIVEYTPGTCVANAYRGATYSPTQNRIYFVPDGQSNQSTWHYVDCDTGLVVAYANGLSITANAFFGAGFMPSLDRLYFAEYSIADTKKYYLETNNVTPTSRTLAGSTIMNHF